MISPKIAINTQNQYKGTSKRIAPKRAPRLPPPNNARKVVKNIPPTNISGEKRIRIGERIKVSPKAKGEVSPASQHTHGGNPSANKAIPAYAI